MCSAKCCNLRQQAKALIENTPLDSVSLSPPRNRYPQKVLWGNIIKGNVCVAGDAFHPITTDIGQGGCAALEDSIILAGEDMEEFKRDWKDLLKRGDGEVLRSSSHLTKIMNFLREKILSLLFLRPLLMKNLLILMTS